MACDTCSHIPSAVKSVARVPRNFAEKGTEAQKDKIKGSIVGPLPAAWELSHSPWDGTVCLKHPPPPTRLLPSSTGTRPSRRIEGMRLPKESSFQGGRAQISGTNVCLYGSRSKVGSSQEPIPIGDKYRNLWGPPLPSPRE